MNKNKALLLGGIILLVVAFILGAMVYKKQESKEQSAAPPAAAENLVRPYSASQGPENAPVTIVEWLDPECEACGRFYPAVKQILREFDGKVRLVVRYMAFHKNSGYAVGVLEGARKQGKYWEALEVIFAKQPEWASHDKPKPELLLTYMKSLGLDVGRITASTEDIEPKHKLAQDMDDGRALGVTGTPTFFVNGKKLQQLGYETLRAAVHAEIK